MKIIIIPDFIITIINIITTIIFLDIKEVTQSEHGYFLRILTIFLIKSSSFLAHFLSHHVLVSLLGHHNILYMDVLVYRSGLFSIMSRNSIDLEFFSIVKEFHC